MLNPIFSNKVQGQKHPGRWGIVEHQIPSIKVLFKTNTKGHKHPGIFINEQDTIGKPKKTKSGIQPYNRSSLFNLMDNTIYPAILCVSYPSRLVNQFVFIKFLAPDVE